MGLIPQITSSIFTFVGSFFQVKTTINCCVILGFNLTETKDGTACISLYYIFIKKKKKRHIFKTPNVEKYYADELKKLKKKLSQFLMEEVYNKSSTNLRVFLGYCSVTFSCHHIYYYH